jgi:NAD(P)-dependent dehydrogenase (short-subunit alcohol dehydrogenase family)
MAASLSSAENGGHSWGILSLFSLKGKTAIVSGASSGIGLAIVEILAEAGANVAILYHRNKTAIESAKTIEQRYKVKCRYFSLKFFGLQINLLTVSILYYRCSISSQYHQARRS